MSYSRWFGFNIAGANAGVFYRVARWKPAMPPSLSLTKRIATGLLATGNSRIERRECLLFKDSLTVIQLGNFAALSLLGIRLQVSVDCCRPLFAHASIFLAQLTYVVVELRI